MHGTMSTALMPAQSGQAGLRAALLAQAGFTGGERFLEGPHGYLGLFGETVDIPALTANLGSRFEITGNTYKPYPCGIVVHPMIDACLQLHAAGVRADDVAEVLVDAAPVALTLANRPTPKDPLEAKVSMQHWAAVSLVDGKAGLAQTRPERVHAPDVTALRARVRLAADPALSGEAARVVVTMTDGSVHRREIVHCAGSSSQPMTDTELSTKFANLAEGILPPGRTDRLLERSWRLSDLADVAVLAGDLA
jgi:2-methylcitrate dehydratase PrpD